MEIIENKVLGTMFGSLHVDYPYAWPFNEDFSKVDEVYAEKTDPTEGVFSPTYVFLKGDSILRVKITVGKIDVNTTVLNIKKIVSLREKSESGSRGDLEIKSISINMDNKEEFSFLRPNIDDRLGVSKLENAKRYENFVALLKNRLI